MAEVLIAERLTLGELPFTLNLPDGEYPVRTDSGVYAIEIMQNRLAAFEGNELVWGTSAQLRASLGERWPSVHKHELRTVVRRVDRAEVARDDLPSPTPDQLFEAAQSYLLKEPNGTEFEGAEPLQAAARDWLARLGDDDRRAFVLDTSITLAVNAAFPDPTVDDFCRAVNVLVRLYMARFNDHFVHEVTESSFSRTAFRGVCRIVGCDGVRINTVSHVGGYFPFILAGPWWTHPEPEVAAFRAALGTCSDPDPVALLHVRARSLLLRGAYRSAIIEASAAFDLCLARKIRAGLAAKGQSAEQIDQALRGEARYKQRAKDLLKQATGTSASDISNARWERFVQDRTSRGVVAHSAEEPPQAEATESVENMIALTESIDQLKA